MLMMKGQAQEVASRGIHVNIQTEISRTAWETPEALRCLLPIIPYGRISQPEDVARAAVWLASNASDHVIEKTLERSPPKWIPVRRKGARKIKD